MTVGTRTTDNTVQEETYYISYPTGTKTSMGFKPVGYFWNKTWNGADYPVTAATPVFARRWEKVDRAVSEMTGHAGLPKITYLDRWLLKRARPRRQYQVDHAYSCTIESWSDAIWKFEYRQTWAPYGLQSYHVTTFRANFGNGYSVKQSSLWTANDTIALQGKLREKIVGSDFDMSVFLGESREALMLIRNSAVRIAGALRSFRRGDLISAATQLGVRPPARGSRAHQLQLEKDAWRNASERWLELQYGWLPLLKDAKGGAEALAQQLNSPLVQTYRVRRTKPIDVDVNVGIRSANDWFWHGFTRVQIIAKLKEADVVSLNGLTDPSSVAWELLPWSFVADWFIPIGNYLAARSMAQSLTGVFVTTTTRKEKFVCKDYTQSTAGWGLVQPPNFLYNYVNVVRTVTTNLATPKPQFKRLDEVFSWKRAANAVALLTTTFAGGKGSSGFRGNRYT